GAKDRVARQEAAVLADFEKPPGFFGRLRTLGSGEERDAIKQALVARAQGEEGTLSPEHQKKLDELMADQRVSDDELRTLANQGAERVRDALTKAGVAAERLQLQDPVIDAADPAVDVALAQGKGS